MEAFSADSCLALQSGEVIALAVQEFAVSAAAQYTPDGLGKEILMVEWKIRTTVPEQKNDPDSQRPED